MMQPFAYNRSPASDQATVLHHHQRLGIRNIYILPSKQGVLFFVLIAVMLAGSINYSNSLGFFLTFLLASLCMVSIFHTHKNLYGLSISLRPVPNVHCGDPAALPIILENTSHNIRHCINIRSANHHSVADVAANTFAQLTLPQDTNQRGWQYLERFTVSSTYPLGLFTAWSHVQLDDRFLVYPKPAKTSPFPQQPTYTPKHSGDKGRGSDDFAGFRNYNHGDHLGHIHWKALARNQGLYVKQFGGDRSDEIWLDWHSLEPMETEQRLCVITRWIIDAEQKGVRYGLLMPTARVEPSHGEVHKDQCLRILALF